MTSSLRCVGKGTLAGGQHSDGTSDVAQVALLKPMDSIGVEWAAPDHVERQARR